MFVPDKEEEQNLAHEFTAGPADEFVANFLRAYFELYTETDFAQHAEFRRWLARNFIESDWFEYYQRFKQFKEREKMEAGK